MHRIPYFSKITDIFHLIKFCAQNFLVHNSLLLFTHFASSTNYSNIQPKLLYGLSNLFLGILNFCRKKAKTHRYIITISLIFCSYFDQPAVFFGKNLDRQRTFFGASSTIFADHIITRFFRAHFCFHIFR